jgi:hypothetical protein
LGNSKNGSSPGIGSRAVAFITCINDLPMIINHVTDVQFADDTSVWIIDENYEDFKQKVNLTLFSISQRFDATQLVLNII